MQMHPPSVFQTPTPSKSISDRSTRFRLSSYGTAVSVLSVLIHPPSKSCSPLSISPIPSQPKPVQLGPELK